MAQLFRHRCENPEASGEAVAVTERRVQDAQKRATRLDQDSQDLDKRYQQLREDAARYEALGKEVQSLRESVSRIEKREFQPSTALTPTLQRQLDSALSGFQTYIRSLGYTTKLAKIVINIAADDKIMPGALAFYDPSKNMIWVKQRAASDATYDVLREYMHSVLYSKGRPDSGSSSHSSDLRWRFTAVEFGLASYFPASYLETPKVQGWNLTEGRQWIDTGNLQAVSDRAQALASAFWQIRTSLGKGEVDKAMLAAWFDSTSLSGDGKFLSGFVSKLLGRLRSDGGKADVILRARGISGTPSSDVDEFVAAPRGDKPAGMGANHDFSSLKPRLISPVEGSEFDRYPRDFDVSWESLQGADSYRVELEIMVSKWYPLGTTSTTDTHTPLHFNAANRGRWRVTGLDKAGQTSQPSDWWTFRFTR